MQDLLTEAELAEKMRVSRVFLYLLRKQGLPYQRIHRMIRYNPAEVETWLAEQWQGNADDAGLNERGEVQNDSDKL